MMARSHLLVGAAAWVLTAPALHLPALDVGELALAMGGALLPDLDHPKSWVGRRTRPVSTVVGAVLGHRGVTHSAVALLALAALLAHAGAARATSAAIAVGYLSHLAADMLTPQGLRLAWPLRRTWCLPVCRTGSAAEPVIVAAFCTFALWRVGHGALQHVVRWPGWPN